MNRLLMLAVLAAATPVSALNLVTGGVGTSGADFLTVGVGARALGMGGAFTAVDSGADANAVNWNPAALALIEHSNVTASYNALFVDENQGYLGYAAPAGKTGGAWGAGVNYLMVRNIEKRAGDTETPDATFSNQNYAAGLSYAQSLGGALFIGGTLKYVRTALDTLKENAMAADAGLLSRTPLDGLTFGAAMKNFGTNIGPDSMPLTLRAGASYRLTDKALTVASDAVWLTTERRGYWNLGTEYWVTQNLAARVGYEFGHGPDQLQSKLVGLGGGVGLKFQRLALDYAFQPYGDLGSTHRVTVGLRFD